MPQKIQFIPSVLPRSDYLSAPSRCSPDNRINPLHAFDAEMHDSPEEEANKPYALIVDDAPDVTEMLAMMLRFSGFHVVAVFSATAALAAAREHHFNVIVSDIGMPIMNGYELAEALRALPDYETVPMIALTGFSMFDDRARALASGFDAFLTKPIDPTKLVAMIEELRR